MSSANQFFKLSVGHHGQTSSLMESKETSPLEPDKSEVVNAGFGKTVTNIDKKNLKFVWKLEVLQKTWSFLRSWNFSGKLPGSNVQGREGGKYKRPAVQTFIKN